MEESKTHWLQNPNKNYLGHWDLPESDDLVLTIESAQWEEVKNPVINVSEAKRVVRFKEDIKPLICNQTNAQSILKATGKKFMEDSVGSKIRLYVSSIQDKKTKEDIDCVRVRLVAPITSKPELTPKHKLWEKASIQVQTGEADFDSISKNWIITEDNFQLLCG